MKTEAFMQASSPMASFKQPSLKALVVFRNYLFKALIRAVHVYESEEVAEEHVVEREYLFDDQFLGYQELFCQERLFTLHKFDVYEHYPGLTNGVWGCIFVFHDGLTSISVPKDLSFSGNPNLALLENLARDLETIYRSVECDDPIDIDGVAEVSGNRQNVDAGQQPSLGTQMVPLLDLNSLPSEAEDEESASMAIGTEEKKSKRAATVIKKEKKRSATEDISKEDLVRYFNIPIVEASKALNVGLTALKKKCRQCGIRRWPHWKLRSLGTLIHDLQGELENQLEEDETAALAVMQKMIESEKESIVKKPSLDIRWETKRLMQGLSKRKHNARVHGILSPTLPTLFQTLN